MNHFDTFFNQTLYTLKEGVYDVDVNIQAQDINSALPVIQQYVKNQNDNDHTTLLTSLNKLKSNQALSEPEKQALGKFVLSTPSKLPITGTQTPTSNSPQAVMSPVAGQPSSTSVSPTTPSSPIQGTIKPT